MAWNIKYYGEWKDFDGNSNRLEILTEQTVTAKEINVNSFVIDYPGIDLFGEEAVYGCGAKIGIMSESKLFYLDELYTINPKGLQVRHYLNSSLNYIGYLDTEQYSDDFSERINYNIELTSNNGLAVLDRIKMMDDNSQVLSGIHRAIDVIKMALNKLSIDFNNFHIGLSTSLENGLLTDETILHKLFIKGANYIDEKGNVMSSRKVINEILLPLSARMYIQGNDVFIVDINELAKGSLTLKTYSFESLLFEQTWTSDNSSDIDVRLGGYSLSMQPGVNKVDLKFNKYVYDSVTEYKLDTSTFSDFISETNVTNSDDEEYNIKRYKNALKYSNLDSNPDTTYFEKITDINKPKNIDYCVRVKGITPTNQLPVFSLQIDTDLNLLSSKNLYLKVFGNMMICDDSDFFKEKILNDYFNNYFYVQFKIGSQYYDPYSGWGESESSITAEYYDYYSDGNNDARFTINKWFDLGNATYPNGKQFDGILIPLNSDLFNSIESIKGGNLTIKIGMYTSIFNLSEYVLRFKDIGFGFVEKDEWGNYLDISNSDEEYQGTVNNYYINDLKVETKHGTDSEANSRGMFILEVDGNYTDSDFATNERYALLNAVIREGFTGTTEELLLRTYLSNLQQSRYVLDCTLPGYHSFFNTFTFDVLKRDTTPVRMLPTTMSVDYMNSTTTLTINEIVKDQ